MDTNGPIFKIGSLLKINNWHVSLANESNACSRQRIVSIEIYTGIQTVTDTCFQLEIVLSIFLFVLIGDYRIGWYR